MSLKIRTVLRFAGADVNEIVVALARVQSVSLVCSTGSLPAADASTVTRMSVSSRYGNVKLKSVVEPSPVAVFSVINPLLNLISDFANQRWVIVLDVGKHRFDLFGTDADGSQPGKLMYPLHVFERLA